METTLRYRESRFDGNRTYELGDTHVHVQGRDFLQRDFEARVPLADLTADPHRIKQRSNSFFAGLILALAFGFSTVVMVGNLSWSVASLGPLLSLVFCGAGVLLMAATWRKVEFATFPTKSGASGLAIARAGPDAGKFEEFVCALSQRVSQTIGT